MDDGVSAARIYRGVVFSKSMKPSEETDMKWIDTAVSQRHKKTGENK